MTDRDLTHLCPRMQDLANRFLTLCTKAPELAGCRVFITETFRSQAEQNNDYQQGRTLPGHIITNAQFGQSPHNCLNPDGTPGAKAFDIAIQAPGGFLDWDAGDHAWQAAIRIGESLGLVSGSTFTHLSDDPHFELPGWNGESI